MYARGKLDNTYTRAMDLAMDFLPISQAAAIASYPWIGRVNKIEADRAGTDAMRKQMNLVNMKGVIVIGEGEMDEAPMLHISESLGTGIGPEVDIAVDPVEGTTLMSKGQGNSLAVIAVSARGSLLHAPDMYMEKIAVGPKAKGTIDINAPFTDNMKSVANALGKDVRELTVMMQDRPRHEQLMQVVIDQGARVQLFSDVDITGVISTALDEMDIDILVGTGGAPEGVLSAVALKCLGGDFQGRLLPQNQLEYNRCLNMGISKPEQVFSLDEIVQTDDCFFVATGITDGTLLSGVRRKADGFLRTHSFIAIGGNVRNYQYIEGNHK